MQFHAIFDGTRKAYAAALALVVALAALEADRRNCVAAQYACDQTVTSLILASAMALALAAGIFFDARYEFAQLARVLAAVLAAAVMIALLSALALPLGGDTAWNALVTQLQYAAFAGFALAIGSIARSIYAYMREY